MNSPSDTATKWRRRAIASIILNMLFVFVLARLAKHVPLMQRICESRDLEELNATIEDGSFLKAVPLSSDMHFRSGWVFPIHWAAAAVNPDAIRLFLEAHVDPNTLNSEGETPIYWLMGHSEPNATNKEALVRECLRLLVSHGADINRHDFRDYPGYTVLHFSARFLYTRDVALLCEFGGDVNAQDDQGNSPLHLAAAEGTGTARQLEWESTLRELIKCGADITIKNDAGELAIDVAKKPKRGYSMDSDIEALLTPK